MTCISLTIESGLALDSEDQDLVLGVRDSGLEDLVLDLDLDF